MISLKQLNYAVVLSKTRHFKKAADLCSVSQSTLSAGIAELEKQLNIQIFERNTRTVFITPVGTQLLQRACEIKTQVDDLYDISRRLKPALSFPFSLGIIPTIAPYLLPQVLPEVRKQYPDLQLTIVEEQSQTLVAAVKSGELDSAILALPYDTSGLHAYQFWQENFYSIFHRDDSHAKQQQISGVELSKTKLMLLKDGNCLKDHALATCKLQSYEHGNYLSGTSLHTLVQMVAGGMGTTIVPEMGLAQLVHGNKELRAVAIDEPEPHRQLAFISRLNYAGVRNIELLMAIFSTELTRQRSGTI